MRRRALAACAALALATPATVRAQAGEVAVTVDGDPARADRIASALREALGARGRSVMPAGSVAAARAFGSLEDPLSPPTAERLRAELGAAELVWVQLRRRGGRLFLALHRVRPGGTISEFGEGSPPTVGEDAAALLARALERAPEMTNARAGGAADAGATDAGGAASPTGGPASPTGGAATATGGPAAVTGGSAAATGGGASGGASADAAATGDGATEDGQETPGPAAAPASGAVGRARAEASEPAETGAGRAFRLRLALVAFAGIESYGYGGGARLEIPLFRMLPDADDAISLGIDLGVSGTHVGLDDQGHGFDAFQIPIATYASWRVVVGDLEIGPRLGAVLMPRFAWISGPRLEGFFADLVGMFLVGAHAGLFLSDDVQLFGGLDLTFGPRVSGLITAGVAL